MLRYLSLHVTRENLLWPYSRFEGVANTPLSFHELKGEFLQRSLDTVEGIQWPLCVAPSGPLLMPYQQSNQSGLLVEHCRRLQRWIGEDKRDTQSSYTDTALCLTNLIDIHITLSVVYVHDTRMQDYRSCHVRKMMVTRQLHSKQILRSRRANAFENFHISRAFFTTPGNRLLRNRYEF